ncbi:MAG: T9SS type A sorting domain-containing protein [Bacteroidia bacterium]
MIPNPATDRALLHVAGGVKSVSELSFTDMSGKAVSIPVQQIRNDWFELDLHQLAKGMYFIIHHSETAHDAVRLVKVGE